MRTEEQALQLVEAVMGPGCVPDYVRWVRLGPKRFAEVVPVHHHADAAYVLPGRVTERDLGRIIHWDGPPGGMTILQDGVVQVRYKSTILYSDEAIIGNMVHEIAELKRLEQSFVLAEGRLTVGDFIAETTARVELGGYERSAHYLAWEVADEAVERFRRLVDDMDDTLPTWTFVR
jgi:hypothetical protein